MKVHVWRSFSSNNSSDFRLVARFASVERTQEVRTELSAFMAAHAKDMDESEDYDALSAAQEALAEDYDFKWSRDILTWGDEALSGNEPDVACADQTLVVYHPYCGGLDDLTPFLKARGATSVEDDDGMPEIGVQLTLAPGKAGERMRAALEAFFAQAETGATMDEWKEPPPWGPPTFRWADAETALFFCDGEHVLFQTCMELEGVQALEKYIRKAKDFRLVICDAAFTRRMKTLMGAGHCPECHASGLRFLPSEGEKLEEDQLLCGACGGMFNLVAMEGLQQAQEKVNAWLASKSVSCSCGSCGGTLMVTSVSSRVDSYKLRCVDCGATTTPKAILRSSSVTLVGTKTIGGVAGDGDTVFLAQEDSKIYRSRGGEKFKAVHKGKRPYCRVFVSSNGRVFASGHGEIIYSDDGGQSWTSVPCKPPLYLFQFSETPAGTIFVPTMGYVYRSKNGGRSFTRAKLPSPRDVFQVLVASEKVLFIMGNGGTLLRSDDGGSKWTKLKPPVSADLLRGLALSEEVMVLVGKTGMALTTANGGKTWTKRRTGTTADIEDITLGNDGRIYAVTSMGEILISANDGKKWSVEPSGTSAHLHSIGALADGTLCMGGADGVLVERDGLDCAAEQKAGASKESHATRKSATKKSATKKSATKKSATKKSATKKSATKK
ncbi:MAG: hypothetical protein JRH20_16160 [Deltaproteobacteria bacterium]|nr:hypothetical protein [Deltaproteobacteria bacterium]